MIEEQKDDSGSVSLPFGKQTVVGSTVILGDCVEVMKGMDDESIDLIILDPPYNIGIDEWDNVGKNETEYIEYLTPYINEALRVLRKNGSLYVFGHFRFIGDIKCFISKSGAKLLSWIIWDKGSKEQNATRTYADVTEHILYFVKGIRKDMNIQTEKNTVREYLRSEKEKANLTNKELNIKFSELYNKVGCKDRSVIEHYFSEMQWVFPTQEIYEKILQQTGFFKRAYHDLKKEYQSLVYTFNHEEIRTKRNPKDKRSFKYENQIMTNVWYFNDKQEMTEYEHPTIKPLQLIKTIIKASSNEGDTVLDCFMGSGTSGVGCLQLNRKFIGVEIDPAYFKIAQRRISIEASKYKLF